MSILSLVDPTCRALPEPLPLLEEMVAASPLVRAASLAFALDRCRPGQPVMIIMPLAEQHEFGCPSLHGVTSYRPGAAILLVTPRKPVEALWAMEQALKSGALGGVVAAIERTDLTSSRRLDFAARDGGTPAMLLRAAAGGLSAARRRWRIAPAPSLPNLFDAHAPGRPCLDVELVRQRDGPPGAWRLRHDPATGGFVVVSRLAADSMATGERRAA